MNNINFKYWLQGWFENAKPDFLNQEDVERLEKHLLVVTNPGDFELWLRGFISGAKADEGVLRLHHIKIIDEELNKNFNNVTENNTLEELLQQAQERADRRRQEEIWRGTPPFAPQIDFEERDLGRAPFPRLGDLRIGDAPLVLTC